MNFVYCRVDQHDGKPEVFFALLKALVFVSAYRRTDDLFLADYDLKMCPEVLLRLPVDDADILIVKLFHDKSVGQVEVVEVKTTFA